MYAPKNGARDTDAASTRISNMHDVFSDWNRRAILYCLQNEEGSVPVSKVARRLAAWKRGFGEESVADPEQIQSHLRAMEQFGILRHDPESGVVTLSEEVTVSVSPPWVDRGTDDPVVGAVSRE